MHSLGFKTSEYALINDGDDCVLIMERKDLHRLEGLRDWFKQVGFDMKVEKPVFELEHIEFCRCKPVQVVEGYKMVRKPRDVLSKECLTWKAVDNEKYWNSYRLAVGLGGQSLAGDIPILSNYYNLIKRGAKGKPAKLPVSSLEYMAKGLVRRDVVQDYTRVSFMKAFNYTPEEQKAIETKFDELEPIYSFRPLPIDIPYHTVIAF
jgi:hypothetical protein